MNTKICILCKTERPLEDFTYIFKKKDYSAVCLACTTRQKKQKKKVNYKETRNLCNQLAKGTL